MRKTLTWLAATLMLAAPAMAGDRPVVVELYTSQGCSSCPPADAYLHELAKRDDVVALALHVDYWDYIGWKDIFANPEFTTRQRAYARRGGRRMIYTPQMIIDGQDHVVGNRPMDVSDLIARHRAKAETVTLDLKRTGGRLEISANAVAGVGGPLLVQLVRYRPKSTVEIKRGENAGRTLDYANVVTELTVLEKWDTSKPLMIDAPLQGELPAVVLIQHYEHGPIEAAAQVR